MKKTLIEKYFTGFGEDVTELYDIEKAGKKYRLVVTYLGCSLLDIDQDMDIDTVDYEMSLGACIELLGGSNGFDTVPEQAIKTFNDLLTDVEIDSQSVSGLNYVSYGDTLTSINTILASL